MYLVYVSFFYLEEHNTYFVSKLLSTTDGSKFHSHLIPPEELVEICYTIRI